jgi:hypothetical protein
MTKPRWHFSESLQRMVPNLDRVHVIPWGDLAAANWLQSWPQPVYDPIMRQTTR